MIQFYIPWEVEGDYDENLKKKHRTGLSMINNFPESNK
jgi:hypothetical protein